MLSSGLNLLLHRFRAVLNFKPCAPLWVCFRSALIERLFLFPLVRSARVIWSRTWMRQSRPLLRREAGIVVAPFEDPIEIDSIIQWPDGVKMQLYWHFTPSTSPPLETIPENRVYLSKDGAETFVRDFVAFSAGTVTADDKQADAGEIGRARETYRRITITSRFV